MSFLLSFVLAPCLFGQSTSAHLASATSDGMVRIRGGASWMGIDAGDIPRFMKTFGIDAPRLFQDEEPRHRVIIDDFSMDANLVTNARFRRFTDAHPEWQPARIPSALHNGNYLKHWKDASALTVKADHPVVNVSWYAAVAYCRSVGQRLPTEAEWEYAARGGGNGLFPWGDAAVNTVRVNFSDSGLGTTSPVGRYPANGYGLFDMAGNVWEFLADEWGPYSSSSAQRNPVAGGKLFLDGDDFLQVKTRRVIRGGSFGADPVNLWVEYRDSHPPEAAKEFVGFRCAK
jgi:formylglycine-generating enzyme